MIIGISGYSGAGKDTVGRIIQYLNCFNVGSVPVQEAIHAEHDWWMEEQSGWEIKKFAGKLKQIASILTGIPIEKFEDQQFKKTNLGKEWNYTKSDYIGGSYTNFREVSMSIRELLQKLGTEGLRTGLHENVWLNALYAEYTEEYIGPDSEGEDIYSFPNWIITDCRFPNEAESIKERNGIIIRVERPGLTQINNHPSEHSLDRWPFDYKIINDGDLDNLKNLVGNILQQENLLKHA